MVLTDTERLCALNFLRYIPVSDLESIAMTVTKGMVAPTSAEDCVKLIIFHSENPRSLLSRKKITKEILFKYLSDYSVPVLATTEKHALINEVVHLWNTAAYQTSLQLSEETKYEDEISLHEQAEGQLQDPVQTQQITSQQLVKQQDVCSRLPLVTEATHRILTATAVPGITAEEVDELALKFSEWFYTLLNSEDKEGVNLGPEHFWQDCRLCLVMMFPSEVVKVARTEAEEVVAVLQSTKHEHELYFNPNLSVWGVKGKLDPHGLVMVFTCGTLHKTHNCVGIFEQMFLLARDPFSSNNWKIKSTMLQLKSSSVDNTPVLQDESISQLLALKDQR